MLNDFHKRMKTERDELSVKTKSLQRFISEDKQFKCLDEVDRNLLVSQLEAMNKYLSILSTRIDILENQNG